MEALELWKRRAIALFVLLSLLLAMLVALLAELGGVVEVANIVFRKDAVYVTTGLASSHSTPHTSPSITKNGPTPNRILKPNSMTYTSKRRRGKH